MSASPTPNNIVLDIDNLTVGLGKDAQTYVPCTISGAMVFGIKCRHMILGRLEPTDIAAST